MRGNRLLIYYLYLTGLNVLVIQSCSYSLSPRCIVRHMDFNVHVPFDVRSAISCGYNHVAVVTLEGKVAGCGVGTAITNALCPQN
jgi:hypothetical protein